MPARLSAFDLIEFVFIRSPNHGGCSISLLFSVPFANLTGLFHYYRFYRPGPVFLNDKVCAREHIRPLGTTPTLKHLRLKFCVLFSFCGNFLFHISISITFSIFLR